MRTQTELEVTGPPTSQVKVPQKTLRGLEQGRFPWRLAGTHEGPWGGDSTGAGPAADTRGKADTFHPGLCSPLLQCDKNALERLKKKSCPSPPAAAWGEFMLHAGNLGTDYLGGPASLAVSWGKPYPWNGEIMHSDFIF